MRDRYDVLGVLGPPNWSHPSLRHTYSAIRLFTHTYSELVTGHAGVHLLVNFIDWCYEQNEQCDGLYEGLECRRSGRVAISA